MSCFVGMSLPMLWAQASSAVAGSSTSAGSATSVLMLALKRWCASLTLSPFQSIPSWNGLWAWLFGLLFFLLVAICLQGPRGFLRQLLDLPSQLRLCSLAFQRLKNSTRLIGFVVGVTMVGWSTNQALVFNSAAGRDDLLILLRGRALTQLSAEQGFFAALTPMRDLLLLGNFIPLLIAGTIVLFQFTSERASSVQRVLSPSSGREGFWGTMAWGSLGLYAIYRFLSLIYLAGDLPLGLGIGVEVAAIPLLMALADGAVLAWVLVEIRNAGLGDASQDRLDVEGLIALLPGSVLACLLAMPARYFSTAVALAFPYVPTPSPGYPAQSGGWTDVIFYFRWMLSYGILFLQAACLPSYGFVSAAAWCRGSWRSLLNGGVNVLRFEGGHLVGVATLFGLFVGLGTALVYQVILSIPPQPWVLNAADAYSHFLTLPVGLLMVSTLIEIGRAALPSARLAPESVVSADVALSGNSTQSG